MQAGLNSRHLTQTQADFGIIKANILGVIQHRFTCTEVGLTMPVSANGPGVREQFVRFSPPPPAPPAHTMSPRRQTHLEKQADFSLDLRFGFIEMALRVLISDRGMTCSYMEGFAILQMKVGLHKESS